MRLWLINCFLRIGGKYYNKIQDGYVNDMERETP